MARVLNSQVLNKCPHDFIATAGSALFIARSASRLESGCCTMEAMILRSFVAVRLTVTALVLPLAYAQTASPSHKAAKSAPAAESHLDPGSLSKGVYRNPSFGFTCKIPEGWVLRTDEMNRREDDGSAEKSAANGKSMARVLLAAFSRPPEAHGEDVNSSILIAAESAAAYPGLKDAAQYFGPIGEVAKAQGLEAIQEPYEFEVGTRLVPRGDFQKDVGSRVMLQSTLAILAKGYAVSFTFIGGAEDEVEELISNLSFATVNTVAGKAK
jgi:hypothetical protein